MVQLSATRCSCVAILSSFLYSFLGSTAQSRPWPPPQNPANFLEASQQFSFFRIRLLTPRLTPIPEDQASLFISPRGRVASHLSRLLRHTWVTLGLFLFPVHHTGNRYYVSKFNVFCRHKPFTRTAKSNTKGKHIFLYRLSPETFGYARVWGGRRKVYSNGIQIVTYNFGYVFALLEVHSQLLKVINITVLILFKT
jgi:hypothetical protein